MRFAVLLVTLYASIAAAGDSWMPLTAHDAPMGNSLIATDPFAPGTLYADASSLRRLAKSADAGKTWTVLPLTASMLMKVIVGPDASQHVTALSADTPDYSIYRSGDGGITWQRHHFSPPVVGPLWDIALGADDWNVYTAHWRNCFGSCLPNSGGVSKSVDGGAHWFAVMKNVQIEQILMDPFSGTVYAIGPVSFRSENGGATWTTIAPPGDSIFRAALDPLVPDVLYASTVNVAGFWRSDDAGRHWQQLAGPFQWGAAWTIAVSPVDRNAIVAGSGNNDSGAARSVDGGKTWQPLRNGLVVPEYPMQIDWIRVVIASDGRVYGAAGFLGAMTLVKTSDGRRRAAAH